MQSSAEPLSKSKARTLGGLGLFLNGTKCLFCGVLVLAFFSLPASSQGTGQFSDDSLSDAGNSISVTEYCHNFAKRYLEMNTGDFLENSVRAVKKHEFLRFISNLFSPSDSRFTAGYDCFFRARNKEAAVQEYSVGLYLTGTRAFAEHTQWEYLQIVPIEPVVDLTNDKAGFGVFKYLEAP